MRKLHSYEKRYSHERGEFLDAQLLMTEHKQGSWNEENFSAQDSDASGARQKKKEWRGEEEKSIIEGVNKEWRSSPWSRPLWTESPRVCGETCWDPSDGHPPAKPGGERRQRWMILFCRNAHKHIRRAIKKTKTNIYESNKGHRVVLTGTQHKTLILLL